MKYALSLLLLLGIALLAGCGHAPERPAPPVEDRSEAPAEPALQALYEQYAQWKGVGYRKGGLSRKGVDCSGFVQITYKERFGVQLPRSTREQATIGTPVEQRELRPGDLVFFKTGLFERHVGIYLEDGRFLHASTNNGVMISRLDERYWRDRYWKAIRVAA